MLVLMVCCLYTDFLEAFDAQPDLQNRDKMDSSKTYAKKELAAAANDDHANPNVPEDTFSTTYHGIDTLIAAT